MRPLVATLIAVVSCSAAVEGALREVRLRAGVSPASDPIQIDYDLVGTKSSQSTQGFDRGYRAAVGLYESFGPLEGSGTWLLGLGLAVSESDVSAQRTLPLAGGVTTTGTSLEAHVIVVDVALGYALPISRRIHLEGQVVLGAGAVRITDTVPTASPASNMSSGDGTYYEGALQAGAYYTFANGLQLGLDGGLLAFRGKAKVNWDDPGSGVYTYKGVGPFANLSIGLRF